MRKALKNPDRLMGRRDLARWAGIGLDCVDKYIRDPDDPLPCLRFGRKFLFERDAVVDWCRRRAERTLARA